MSVFAQRMGTSTTGASLILGGTFSMEKTAVIHQGVRDKITSAANRCILLYSLTFTCYTFLFVYVYSTS